MSSTANMMRRMPSVFTGASSGSALTAVGVWNLSSSNPPVAVRGPHHCDVASDAVEPDDAVHPLSLDGRFALKLQTKFSKALVPGPPPLPPPREPSLSQRPQVLRHRHPTHPREARRDLACRLLS